VSWSKEIEEIHRRRRLAKAMGGERGIARQRAKGVSTIRERVDALLDPGSFREHGAVTGATTAMMPTASAR